MNIKLVIVLILLFNYIEAATSTVKPVTVNATVIATKPVCKIYKTFLPGSCVCKANSVCTKKRCYCYKQFKTCSADEPFTRRRVCLCPKNTVRKCIKKWCSCEGTGKPKPKGKPKKPVPSCKLDSPYVMGSCLCPKTQRCNKSFAPKTAKPTDKYCTCLSKLSNCPAKGTFARTLTCACKGLKNGRKCKGLTCSCDKLPMCNQYRTYPNLKSCYCHQVFTFLTCKVNKKGDTACKCEHLSKSCPMNTQVKKDTCFCDLKKNTWKCKKGNCICQKKELCPLDEFVERTSCQCKRPTTDLEDENSELKRVYRGFGWKKCYPIDPKNPKSRRICSCEALKCYETFRFKKYFCKCPRQHFQLCNKSNNYCKCVPKKPISKRYKGMYKFEGLIPTDSKLIASRKYEKRSIKVYTEDGKKKEEQRFAFVDHTNGSFYIIKKPSIKTSVEEKKELSLYDVANLDNLKFIQKQLTKKFKKSPYYDYIYGKKTFKTKGAKDSKGSKPKGTKDSKEIKK